MNKAAATYRNDLLRAPFAGILEAGWTTFALVIAIRYFDAGETQKAFIAGSGPIGFLLTPVTLYLAAHLRATPGRSCALIFAVAAVLLIGAGLATSLQLFTLFAVTSQMAAVQQGPLMLQIYTENYTRSERGSRMTWPFILTAVFSIGFAVAGGRVLDRATRCLPLDFSSHDAFGSDFFCRLLASTKQPTFPRTRRQALAKLQLDMEGSFLRLRARLLDAARPWQSDRPPHSCRLPRQPRIRH
jgi:MFS family permease